MKTKVFRVALFAYSRVESILDGYRNGSNAAGFFKMQALYFAAAYLGVVPSL